MSLNNTTLYICKLSVLVSVGSLILTGCSSNTSMSGTGEGVGTVTTPTVQQNPTYPQPDSTGNVDGSSANNEYSTALLDASSLAELENLLEATDMQMVEGDKLLINQFGNLWDRLNTGFALDQSQYLNNTRVQSQKSWFVQNQNYINRLTARASRYLYHTVLEAERRNIPTELALLPVIESSYDPTGTSNAAAAGLWQFIPSTGRIYGLNQTQSYDGRRDVIESTRAAYDFLTTLYNRFGSWELALAAYNAGPTRIQNAIDDNQSRGLPTDFWSLQLPAETMNYVPRFLAVSQIVNNTNAHGIYLPAIANRQHFRSVPVNYGVRLQDVAQVTGVDFNELRMLNPALTNSIVDPAGPNRVLIPNSLNSTVDDKIRRLSSQGYGNNNQNTSSAPYNENINGSATTTLANMPLQINDYIAPKQGTVGDSRKKQAAQAELQRYNTLPTTYAQITPNYTIIQQPVLSAAEKQFIADQLKVKVPSIQNVISSSDGNIRLDALQTQQSILQELAQYKHLTFGNSIFNATNAPAYNPTIGQQSYYSVVPGETVESFARRFGLDPYDVAAWNNLSPQSVLSGGTELIVYGDVAPSQNQQSNADTYVVQSGDTLIGTAQRFNLSVSQLASYNGLSTNSKLYKGQTLWLVPNSIASQSPSTNANNATNNSYQYEGPTQSYRVKRGDSLTIIASKFDTNVSTLAAMNNMNIGSTLYANQRLKVPAVQQSTSSNTSAASSSTASQNSSSYQGATSTYTVKSGETLYGIAKKLGVSSSQIADINSFSSNTRLQRGQRIKLPATSEKVSVRLDNKSATYKIQSGDTLIGVANKFGVTVSQLAHANDMSTNAQLIRGRTLTIPSDAASQPSTNNRTTASQSSSNSPKTNKNQRRSTEKYTVKSGDTLIGIANKYGLSVSQLASANNLATNAKLRINQKLTIPATVSRYKVVSGDTLIGLARKYNVSVAELASMNDIQTNTQLRRGQILNVPANLDSHKSVAVKPSKSSTSSTSTTKTPTYSGKSTTYVVKSGDTLIGVANRNGLSVSQLAAANDLSTKAQLRINQKIIIPSTTTSYKVLSGDSLIGLARKFGISTSELAKMNGLDQNAMLQKGQVLKVPVQ